MIVTPEGAGLSLAEAPPASYFETGDTRTGATVPLIERDTLRGLSGFGGRHHVSIHVYERWTHDEWFS